MNRYRLQIGLQIGLATVLLLIGTGAMATHTTTVFGNGSSSGTCDGQNFNFCSSDLKQSAERDANEQMNNQCIGGQIEFGETFCNDDCNPLFLSPQAPMTWVYCRTQCNGTCQLPN